MSYLNIKKLLSLQTIEEKSHCFAVTKNREFTALGMNNSLTIFNKRGIILSKMNNFNSNFYRARFLFDTKTLITLSMDENGFTHITKWENVGKQLVPSHFMTIDENSFNVNNFSYKDSKFQFYINNTLKIFYLA